MKPKKLTVKEAHSLIVKDLLALHEEVLESEIKNHIKLKDIKCAILKTFADDGKTKLSSKYFVCPICGKVVDVRKAVTIKNEAEYMHCGNHIFVTDADMSSLQTKKALFYSSVSGHEYFVAGRCQIEPENSKIIEIIEDKTVTFKKIRFIFEMQDIYLCEKGGLFKATIDGCNNCLRMSKSTNSIDDLLAWHDACDLCNLDANEMSEKLDIFMELKVTKLNNEEDLLKFIKSCYLDKDYSEEVRKHVDDLNIVFSVFNISGSNRYSYYIPKLDRSYDLDQIKDGGVIDDVTKQGVPISFDMARFTDRAYIPCVTYKKWKDALAILQAKYYASYDYAAKNISIWTSGITYVTIVNKSRLRLFEVGCDEDGKVNVSHLAYSAYLRKQPSKETMCNVLFTQDDETIREVVNSSCMEHSGYLEAIGKSLTDYGHHYQGVGLDYLHSYVKNNGVELLIKSNIQDGLVKGLVEDVKNLKKSNTLEGILGVSRHTVKVMSENSLYLDEFSQFDKLYKVDNSLTYEMFRMIMDSGVNTYYMFEMIEKYHLTCKRIMDYLQHVYDHQCIALSNAFYTWYDYLRMAECVGIDVSSKKMFYPSSLKKEHDIAMFAYNKIKSPVDEEAFRKQAEINARYEFSFNNLTAIVPKSVQDVIDEAKHQNNCLRSYIGRLQRGATVVAFIRKKSDPDRSYVTCEIQEGELIQVAGRYNSEPKDPELYDFIRHWALACGFNYSNRRYSGF